ncbi:sulfotransferase [Methylocaldum sp. MU1018]
MNANKSSIILNRTVGSLPIFILSCERSGSTLLRYIVDTHHDICCPGQLYLGKLCHSLYTSAYYSISQVSIDDDEEEKQRIAFAEARQTVENLMGRYVNAKGKRMWCDKTTANVEYLTVLDRTFTEAGYILLYRHCMDVAYSCIRTSKFGFMPELSSYLSRSPENFVTAVIESWTDKTRKLLEFEGKNKNKTHRLTYESLVSDPARVLPAMFEFMGVDWNDAILEQCFCAQHDKGEGDTKIEFEHNIHMDSIGKGYAIPRDFITDAMRRQADELLACLGYPSIDDYFDFHADRKEATEGKAPAYRSDNGRIRDFLDRSFAARGKRIGPANLVGKSCKVIVSDVEGGIWIIDPTASEKIRRTDDQKTTCTILLTSDLLIDMVEKKQNPVSAYEEGKLEVIGNVAAAFEFGRILFN